MSTTKCERAVDVIDPRVPKYRRCGKPAVWVAGDELRNHEYGLCDKHLAEMREKGIITARTPVRALAGNTA